MVQNYIDAAISKHRLPEDFQTTVNQWYRPLAKEVADRHAQAGRTLVLGVQGTQGSGKSTLADFLKLLLLNEHNLNTVALSIDDFYLTLADRETLATTTHPLLRTRGVPGTHDTALALRTLAALKVLAANERLPLPSFNKAIDDRADAHTWAQAEGPVDVVILEGWCVGLTPQPEEELITAVNELESREDTDGCWRHYVNQALQGPYQVLHGELDALVVLTAPSFDCVFDWRLLQEEKLAASLADADAKTKSKIQTPAQVKRFISHYQRLTEHGLRTLPAIADWTLSLDQNHRITGLQIGGPRD